MPNSQDRFNRIKNRLAEYKEHKNDAYAYDLREIKAVREFQDSAADDIEFLLGEIQWLVTTIKNS